MWLAFAQILQFLSNIQRKTFCLGDVLDIESERDGWEGYVGSRLVRGKDCIEGSQQIGVSTKREGGIMLGAVEGRAEYLHQFSKVDRAVTSSDFLKWKEQRTSQSVVGMTVLNQSSDPLHRAARKHPIEFFQ